MTSAQMIVSPNIEAAGSSHLDRIAIAKTRACYRMLLTSPLSADNSAELKRKAESLNGFLDVDSTEFYEAVTHLVAGKEVNIDDPKLLAALLFGKWIVSPSFINESFKVNQWLPETGFLLQPGSCNLSARQYRVVQATRNCRMWINKGQRSRIDKWKLTLISCSQFNDEVKTRREDMLKSLIKICGGTLVNCTRIKDAIADGITHLILTDDDSTLRQCLKFDTVEKLFTKGVCLMNSELFTDFATMDKDQFAAHARNYWQKLLQVGTPSPHSKDASHISSKPSMPVVCRSMAHYRDLVVKQPTVVLPRLNISDFVPLHSTSTASASTFLVSIPPPRRQASTVQPQSGKQRASRKRHIPQKDGKVRLITEYVKPLPHQTSQASEEDRLRTQPNKTKPLPNSPSDYSCSVNCPTPISCSSTAAVSKIPSLDVSESPILSCKAQTDFSSIQGVVLRGLASMHLTACNVNLRKADLSWRATNPLAGFALLFLPIESTSTDDDDCKLPLLSFAVRHSFEASIQEGPFHYLSALKALEVAVIEHRAVPSLSNMRQIVQKMMMVEQQKNTDVVKKAVDVVLCCLSIYPPRNRSSQEWWLRTLIPAGFGSYDYENMEKLLKLSYAQCCCDIEAFLEALLDSYMDHLDGIVGLEFRYRSLLKTFPFVNAAKCSAPISRLVHKVVAIPLSCDRINGKYPGWRQYLYVCIGILISDYLAATSSDSGCASRNDEPIIYSFLWPERYQVGSITSRIKNLVRLLLSYLTIENYASEADSYIQMEFIVKNSLALLVAAIQSNTSICVCIGSQVSSRGQRSTEFMRLLVDEILNGCQSATVAEEIVLSLFSSVNQSISLLTAFVEQCGNSSDLIKDMLKIQLLVTA